MATLYVIEARFRDRPKQWVPILSTRSRAHWSRQWRCWNRPAQKHISEMRKWSVTIPKFRDAPAKAKKARGR